MDYSYECRLNQSYIFYIFYNSRQNISSDLLNSSVEDMTLLPPSGFSDSRELSDVECDRDRERERDREWQGLSAGTRHGGSLGRLPIEAVESMLARYWHIFIKIIF